MITKDTLKVFLLALNFEKSGEQYRKNFPDSDTYLAVDFGQNKLIYPEDQDLSKVAKVSTPAFWN